MNGGTWGAKLLGWVLSGALVMCPKPVAMAQSGEKLCYVALGDSVSSGYGLEEETQMFTQQVARENGFTLISLAQNGETSRTLLERLEDPEAMQTVAQADVITMTVGGNDLMQALYAYLADQYHASNPDASPTGDEMQKALMGGDMDMITFALGEIQGFSASDQEREALTQFTANLTQVVARIQGDNPEVCLVMANQYNPYSYLLQEFTKYPPLAEAAQEVEDVLECGVSALNAAISSVGEQMGYAVADVYTVFQDAGENPCNAEVSAFAKVNLDFHPNAYGHSLIAQVVTEATQLQCMAMGKGALTVSGGTTKLVQPQEKSGGWRWAVLGCGTGLTFLGVILWGRIAHNRGV